MRRIRDAVEPLPKAVFFDLAEAGFGSPCEILAACIITIRTREEVSWHCAPPLRTSEHPGRHEPAQPRGHR